MEHRKDRLRRTVSAVTAAVTAAAVAFALAPAANAEPAGDAPGKAPAVMLAERESFAKPAAAGVGTRSGSGARSGDFTNDYVHDILARNASNGQLKVYPHSGSYNGTATFQPGVTINHGWGGMRWIGQGDLTGDDKSDVLYIDQGGNMRLAPHSGAWDGTNTLLPGEFVGSGWHITDMVFTDDWDADGLDDVMARFTGTGELYMYRNTGLSGTAKFEAPLFVAAGPTDDVQLSMGDFTRDGVTDLLFVQRNGIMGVYDLMTDEVWAIGYGWESVNAITLADIDIDGVIDVLGRRKYDNALVSYTNAGWSPDHNTGTAFSTLNAPVLIGLDWHINDVIT